MQKHCLILTEPSLRPAIAPALLEFTLGLARVGWRVTERAGSATSIADNAALIRATPATHVLLIGNLARPLTGAPMPNGGHVDAAIGPAACDAWYVAQAGKWTDVKSFQSLGYPPPNKPGDGIFDQTEWREIGTAPSAAISRIDFSRQPVANEAEAVSKFLRKATAWRLGKMQGYRDSLLHKGIAQFDLPAIHFAGLGTATLDTVARASDRKWLVGVCFAEGRSTHELGAFQWASHRFFGAGAFANFKVAFWQFAGSFQMDENQTRFSGHALLAESDAIAAVSCSSTARTDRFNWALLTQGLTVGEIWRRASIGLLATPLCGDCTATLPPPKELRIGDLNADGKVDFHDLMQYARDKPDLTGDGVTNNADLLVIAQRYNS
jgi:hypothetical protein